MRDVVERPDEVRGRGSKAVWMRPPFKDEPVRREVDVEALCAIGEGVVRETIMKTKAESLRVEEELIGVWGEGESGKIGAKAKL